jgi:site-specific DNA recombinase
MKSTDIPCAIYTRKSSEEGLEQDFNSLDAQREACAAYILSQKAMGWVARKDAYDDGGFSGGSTERPGLQKLLTDIEAGKVKVVVVYKVDRLTRSLADFAKMVELFDAHGVSFVSVTQQFNTTSSMGRLTLNVLLSFAQFEREVTGERIRDKIAASKRKGMWMGGLPPVGYTPHERTLVIDEPQAERVREIFKLYLELDCVRLLGKELLNRNWLTPPRNSKRQGGGGNRPYSRGHLYRLLRNPIYIGRVPHRDESYEGNHPAIIDQATWNAVQQRLEDNRQGHRHQKNAVNPSLLAGLIFDPLGNRYTTSHSTKNSKRYRYYIQEIEDAKPVRIPAQDLESVVLECLKDRLSNEPWVATVTPDDAQIKQAAISKGALLSRKLEQQSVESTHTLISKIVVHKEQLEIHIKLEPLCGSKLETVTHIPATLKRTGMAVRLIVQTDKPKTNKPDKKLIRFISRGFDWAVQFTSGEVKTIKEIADKEGVAANYITRVMYSGFMNPDLMNAVCKGMQPPDLNSIRLLRIGNLTLDWDDQRQELGFGSKALK